MQVKLNKVFKLSNDLGFSVKTDSQLAPFAEMPDNDRLRLSLNELVEDYEIQEEMLDDLSNKLTDITNDTEDLVIGRIEFKNGTLADFTLNYLSEEYQRYYDILEDGVLKRRKLTIDNQMYIDEIVYFVNCVKSKTQGMNSFKEAHGLLKELI